MMLLELFRRWSELEPERCQSTGFWDRFHVAYNLQNGYYVQGHHPDSTDLAIIQRAIQSAIVARKWPFDLSFGSYGYKVWIQAGFGKRTPG